MSPEDVADLRRENWQLQQLLEGLVKTWHDYFLPDVGPPGDEDKRMLFNRWTDTVEAVATTLRRLE